ncbi:UV radiation resistance-associated protein-like [Xenia sp. Carnegie-2017]|uniref:UV radiation resistance-associated protein-like n=1 Tax=Xenia sp. Carnegie-2017 TaxID=2897299 RepID=UPI001F03BC6D|nr:UV radiation resistance-associated protein-like [Xenia sp. Carnegie-2017]
MGTVMHARVAFQRRKHVDLSSQQRRLRHVTSIFARNIKQRGFASLRKLGTYFSIYLGNIVVYTSEIKSSFNPTWQSFDVSQFCEDLNTASSSFIVRIWGGENGSYQLLIEWNVDLNGLVYLGEKIDQNGCYYEANLLIFGLQDGYYIPPKDTQNDDEIISKSLLKVDQEMVKSSYNLSSLHRLHTLVRAIRQTQIQIRKIKTSAQENLHISGQRLHRACERERLKLSVRMLQEELHKHKNMLDTDQKMEVELVRDVQHAGNKLRNKVEGFEVAKRNFDEAKKNHIARRELLVKTKAQVVMRRRQLCHELTYIYPIETSKNEEMILCGLPLPNTQSPEFNGVNEETISSALGYVNHLLSMIARYFQIPLRYPAINKGSRSTIFDFVNEKLPDKEREFPLFVKGKERFQFDFGVFLLNKNIAQIRYSLGLATTDLRRTLPNIKNLFDMKFGGSSPYVSCPISVIKRHLSPTEGGKDKVKNEVNCTTKQNGSLSSQDYICQDTNETVIVTHPPSKSQTSKIVSGQSFCLTTYAEEEENNCEQSCLKAPERSMVTKVNETGNQSSRYSDSLNELVPNNRVESGQENDDLIDNLFSV